MPDQRRASMQLGRQASDRLTAAGRDAFPGFSLRVLARTPSTQDVVRAAALSGASEGYCCVAAEQSSGRGRQGRRWSAPPGTALLASVLLRPAPSMVAGVPIAAGLAIADALTSVCAVDVGLKWPNDLLAGNAKVGGVLAEVIPVPEAGPAVVLGFGVNLAVETFPDGVAGASLHRLCPAGPPAWDMLFAAALSALSRRMTLLRGAGLPSLLPDWRARASGLGSRVEAETPSGRLRGVALDIDDEGALLVATPAGTVRMLAADVHIGPAARGAERRG